MDFDTLAQKIRSLLIGNGIKPDDLVMYDDSGNDTALPADARSFFVTTPNIMVLLKEKSPSDNSGQDCIQFHYYSGNEKHKKMLLELYKNIQKLADEFIINCELSKNSKEIKPKQFAHYFKDKMGSVMENNNLQPKNHRFRADVLKKVKYMSQRTPVADYTLADELGLRLDQIRPILNDLTREGALKASMDHGVPVYSIPMEEAIVESFSRMFGSKRTSQQTLENVRILIKHKKPVNEEVRGARTRQISAIFLECNGERFKFKENYLPGARAMAQHLAHGGSMVDKVGQYITESTTHLLKLQSFNRYVTTNKLINEDSSSIVETIKENIGTLRLELKKLTGKKTYESVRARIETFDREALSEDDVSQLKDLFTIRKFDEKFEEVLPIVKQLIQEKDTYHKRIEEASANIIKIKRESINNTPILEFSSENASLGYKISQLSLRIIENEELSDFVNKVGVKLSKDGKINAFEHAIMNQVFENIKVDVNSDENSINKVDIKESVYLKRFFDKFDRIFL